MKGNIWLFIDWARGVWAMQYRNNAGEMVCESTAFPASMPSVVVSDELQKAKPHWRVFAKLG